MAAPKTKPKTKVKIRAPRKGTKSEAILTLATTTPATGAQISRALDCDAALVTTVLQRYGIERNQVESYKKFRADIFAGLQHKVAISINDEDIQKASLYQKAGVIGLLHENERLELEKSTANIAYDSASIRDRYQELKAMLAEAVDNQGIEQNDQVVDIASNGNEGQ